MVDQNGKNGKYGPKCTPLPIKQHGNQWRTAVTVPMTVADDQDLIKAIESIPNRERLTRIREALRVGLELTTPEDGLKGWFAEQLTGLHQYLEGKFGAIGSVTLSQPPAEKQVSGKMSEEQRRKRLKNVAEDDY